MIWITYWIKARKEARCVGEESEFVAAYERLRSRPSEDGGAPVYGRNERQHYRKLGDIVCSGKDLSPGPPKDSKLKGFLQTRELNTGSGVRKFDPKESPSAWLQNFYRCYQSAALRVYRAEELRPLK